jgi:hypothetical protein
LRGVLEPRIAIDTLGMFEYHERDSSMRHRLEGDTGWFPISPAREKS